MMAVAASAPPCSKAGCRGVDAGEQQVHRQPLTDQAGGADDHIAGRDAELGGHPLGGRVGVLKPPAPVQALAPPELEHDRVGPAVGQDPLGPQDRAACTRFDVKTAAAT